MPWMTILRCADNSYYVGSTIDLQRRVRDHNDGHGAQYTARRRPVELVYAAEFADIRQVYAAEKIEKLTLSRRGAEPHEVPEWKERRSFRPFLFPLCALCAFA